MYYVALSCFHETAFVVEKQYLTYFSVCVWGGGGWMGGWVNVGARALACVCAGVALIIQHTTRHHIVIFGLCGSTIFLDSIS
jgi:hypothetical protein